MLDDETVRSLERHWEEGWNGVDLETIMAPFADQVVFSSPFVSRMTADPEKSEVRGYDALRHYVANALRRSGAIRYTLDSTFVGTDSVVLMYTCVLPDGSRKTGADSMHVGPDGKVDEWRCHYTRSSMQPT